jgi:hypothetical protein
MLELAKFIGKEKPKLAAKTFMLMPSEFSEAIKPHSRFAKCTYRFLYKGKQYEPETADLIKMQGRFGLIIRKIPNDEALIEIKVECQAGTWASEFVPVSLMNINLQKDN